MKQKVFRVVCGKTRSGVEISYLLAAGQSLGPKEPQIFNSLHDYFDAFALFHYLASEEYRRNFGNEFFDLYRKHAMHYKEIIDKIVDIEKYKTDLGLSNSEDFLFFGKQQMIHSFLNRN